MLRSNNMTILLVILGVAAVAGTGQGASLGAAAPDTLSSLPRMGFLDENIDGINDGFRDREGDGVNDLTGAPYRHNFDFRDADADGINDLFVDADGDGENDIAVPLADGPDSSLVVRFIDGDDDGLNDVLGPCRWSGRDFGFVDESRGEEIPFVDEDGDGLNDLFLTRRMPSGYAPFVDSDGDGVQDNRTLHHRGRGEGSGQGQGRRYRGGR